MRGTGEREIGKRNREKGREEGRGGEILRDKFNQGDAQRSSIWEQTHTHSHTHVCTLPQSLWDSNTAG